MVIIKWRFDVLGEEKTLSIEIWDLPFFPTTAAKPREVWARGFHSSDRGTTFPTLTHVLQLEPGNKEQSLTRTCVCVSHIYYVVSEENCICHHIINVWDKNGAGGKKRKNWKELGREFEVVSARLPNFPGSRWYWREIKMKCLVLLICAVGTEISNICITFEWDNEEIAVCSLKPSWGLRIAGEGTWHPRGRGVFSGLLNTVFPSKMIGK